MRTNPHRWPGLRVVDGPPLPLLADVDVFAAPVGVEVRIAAGPHATRPFDVAFDTWLDEDVRSGEGPPGSAAIWATDDGWGGRPLPGHSFGVLAGGSVVQAGPWHLELVDDAGALVRVQRRGSAVFARPLGLRSFGRTTAVWLMASAPDFWALVDDDGFHRLPRESGVALRTAMGRMDAERAKAIALMAHGKRGSLGLGFDGALYADQSPRNGRVPTAKGAKAWFRELTGLERTEAQSLFDATDACSASELKAFARVLDPVAAEREELLREECAIAADT